MRALLVGSFVGLAAIACLNLAPAGQTSPPAHVDQTQQPEPGLQGSGSLAQPSPATQQPVDDAHVVPTSCPTADVQAVDISSDIVYSMANQPEVPSILTLDADASEPSDQAPGTRVLIALIGPYLESNDSSAVKTDVSCTTQGLTVAAMITRSSLYAAFTANWIWRPHITLDIVLHRPAIDVESIWRMRLGTTGEELDKAKTTGHPVQAYPIAVRRSIP